MNAFETYVKTKMPLVYAGRAVEPFKSAYEALQIGWNAAIETAGRMGFSDEGRLYDELHTDVEEARKWVHAQNSPEA